MHPSFLCALLALSLGEGKTSPLCCLVDFVLILIIQYRIGRVKVWQRRPGEKSIAWIAGDLLQSMRYSSPYKKGKYLFFSCLVLFFGALASGCAEGFGHSRCLSSVTWRQVTQEWIFIGSLTFLVFPFMTSRCRGTTSCCLRMLSGRLLTP